MARLRRTALIVGAALAIAGCGGGSGSKSRAAPSASDFPKPQGRTMERLMVGEGGAPSEQGPFLAPAQGVLRPGTEQRYAFALLNAGHDFVKGVDKVALYVADSPSGAVRGPFPARTESLTTQSRFRSKTTAEDSAAPKFLYVARLPLPRTGEVQIGALIRSGGRLKTLAPVSGKVAASPRIPAVGDRAPRIHTPTAADVPDIKKIDTRDPADTQHSVDLYDVLGKRPVVLTFATPLLCQSRVCGPTVDVTEQLKQTTFRHSNVAFIHMEVWKDNDVNKGPRPQMLDYHLTTEPWIFVIDRRGIVRSAIEGGIGVDELTRDVRKVSGGTG